ncbi:DNA-binding protein SMUBP-2 [Trichonephila inaurata madagascariensis]|uniref:DNA-binding protein SMUBP-2 n=1 Tax=Trichonephila inaurata madagascariensis TaxID=2747483 RepID=A0A8X7C3L5_9ARAC|nr:DNA-binding protein SMUBP-2 [Trichonephila inaurata madagascariensis]
MEVACWISLLLAKKCILAGDHHQLSPTILSKKAAGLVATFYENKLVANETVRSSVLSDLSGVDATDITSKALMIIHTSGFAMRDQLMDGNKGEARLVEIHIDQLVQWGLQASSIAVFTPYKF